MPCFNNINISMSMSTSASTSMSTSIHTSFDVGQSNRHVHSQQHFYDIEDELNKLLPRGIIHDHAVRVGLGISPDAASKNKYGYIK